MSELGKSLLLHDDGMVRFDGVAGGEIALARHLDVFVIGTGLK